MFLRTENERATRRRGTNENAEGGGRLLPLLEEKRGPPLGGNRGLHSLPSEPTATLSSRPRERAARSPLETASSALGVWKCAGAVGGWRCLLRVYIVPRLTLQSFRSPLNGLVRVDPGELWKRSPLRFTPFLSLLHLRFEPFSLLATSSTRLDHPHTPTHRLSSPFPRSSTRTRTQRSAQVSITRPSHPLLNKLQATRSL